MSRSENCSYDRGSLYNVHLEVPRMRGAGEEFGVAEQLLEHNR